MNQTSQQSPPSLASHTCTPEPKGELKYKITSTLSGDIDYEEQITRQELLKDIDTIQKKYCQQSNNTYHLNGDVTINMHGSEYTVKGFYKHTTTTK